MKKVQLFFEKQAFGVCTYLGDKLGLPTIRIRLFFIYASFITVGSPVIIYLTLAFLMNVRSYIRKKYNSVFYF
jgi:phage shock protein C